MSVRSLCENSHGRERVAGVERPRFANFSFCANSKCDGLCYHHHKFSDSAPVTLEEISSCVCTGNCTEEYCHVKTCRAFWKLQKEIVNLRERIFKSSEKHRKKCANYHSEISILTASRQKNNEQTFSEAVRTTFSDSFRHLKTSIDEQEVVIRDDFCRTLCRFEKIVKEKDDEIAQLREYKSILESKVTSLESEVSRLQRLVASKVQRDRSSPYY